MFESTIRVETEENTPLVDAKVLVIFPASAEYTYITTDTTVQGWINVHIPNEDWQIRVFCAKHGYHSTIVESWVPSEGELKMCLREYPGGGSDYIPFRDSDTGTIPGLDGDFTIGFPGDGSGDTPIQLRTTGLTIDGGGSGDAMIGFGQVISLADASGKKFSMAIRDMVGMSVLFEYWQENAPRTHSYDDGSGGAAGAIN